MMQLIFEGGPMKGLTKCCLQKPLGEAHLFWPGFDFDVLSRL